MDNKGRGIDEIIQQAMRAGDFDNLPGKGKPLDLDDNPHLDPEWQLAYHLLKQNGFAPEFVEKRQQIELDLAKAREALTRTWVWRQTPAQENTELANDEWQKAKRAFETKVQEINKAIVSYNLTIPVPSLFRSKIDLETELAPFG